MWLEDLYIILCSKERSKQLYSSNDNIKKVKAILNIIGSPFNNPLDINEDDDYDFIELYDIAKRNKIGLLLLESLTRKKNTNELDTELDKQREISKTLRITAERAASILNRTQCKYAIVKSNYPFPVTPNDVDLLIFGDNNEYRHVINSMKENHFEPVDDEAPLEVCMHDTTRAKHFNDPLQEFAQKDPYDVDIYKEIGASHIIYMNKRKLVDQISEITINSTKVNILKTPAEIALSIFHSIYPERLYTLLLHLHILYAIKEMRSTEVDDFLRIHHENKMHNAVLIVLSLTEKIEEICFGVSPSKLIDLREAFGKQKQIQIDRLPYLYPMRMVFNSFWGKRNDLVFTKSVVQQIISMLNPVYTHYILKVYKDRNKRSTY
jgi:hypothetical protein